MINVRPSPENLMARKLAEILVLTHWRGETFKTCDAPSVRKSAPHWREEVGLNAKIHK